MSARTILNPAVSLTSGQNTNTITVGTLNASTINSDTGIINSTSALTLAGTANFGNTSVEAGIAQGTIAICRNLTGGSDEFDIAVVNAYNSTLTTNPVLNIYTSQTTIDGGDMVGGDYKPPLVSMTTTQVIINGSIYPTSFVDSTGSSGTNGQVITANGSGGWSWA